MAIGLQKMFVLTQKRAFYLTASHRQIKKSLLCACAPERFGAQVRPRRLCGENSILDKNAQIYYSQKYQEGNRQGHFVAILA